MKLLGSGGGSGALRKGASSSGGHGVMAVALGWAGRIPRGLETDCCRCNGRISRSVSH